MADNSPLVAPFTAERFADQERLSTLISPPYDVISPSRRVELEGRHARNIVRLILPEGNGDRYEAAHALLEAWRGDGSLVRDPEPGVYVIQQAFATHDGRRHVRTGLLAALGVEPYDGGRVRPHEKTHRGPKEDRLALMRATETMFEALFMLAPDPENALRDALLSAANGPPGATAELDGVEISIWPVTGPAGSRLADLAGGRDVYIADGHHRYETAVAFREECPAATHTLALIVPRGDPGLVVLPTFRIIEDAGLDGAGLRKLLDRFCDLRLLESGDPGGVARSLEGGCLVWVSDGVFVVSERGDATLPRLTVNLDPAVQHLNVARVDAMVVDAIVQATGGAVTYSADSAEVGAAVERGAAGVLLPATGVDEVIGVANAGGYMPQKSTYFQPKVPSGLVMMPVAGT